MIKPILKFFLRLALAVTLVSLFFIITQDFQIFPGLYGSYIWGYKSVPPAEVEPLTTKAADGHTVHFWRMKAENNPDNYSAILFHGNAEYISNQVFYQRWLKSLNIHSYSVEYRGYMGRWSGWPSENGFYLDADAVYNFMVGHEKILPDKIISFGNSIGTGTASYLAAKFDTKALVLISPYTSLKKLVARMPLLGYLSPFLKYNFPNDDYISKLINTCVVSAHGREDSTIPFYHSEELKNLYAGKGSFTLVGSDEAGHNDLLPTMTAEIGRAINNCLK